MNQSAIENSDDVFSLIVNSANHKIKAIERMQNSTTPLLIYGAGGYAKGLLLFLSRYGIRIEAAIVDEEFFTSPTRLQDIPVFRPDEVANHFGIFNVLIGFADFRTARKKVSSLNNCNEIFFLDSALHLDFFDYRYVRQNWASFLETYNLLEDDVSKKTMIAFINAKISGVPEELYELVAPDQYFPSGIIELTGREIFVDAGAFDGDTLTKFVDRVRGSYRRIYAFEPDLRSYEKLLGEVNKKSYERIELFNKGVWEVGCRTNFRVDGDIAASSDPSISILINVASW